MMPYSDNKTMVTNTIVVDGCIDLVIDYDNKQIGYAGMSKTVFDDVIYLPNRWAGMRMKPGAFEQLTGLTATTAMDSFLHLETVDHSFQPKDLFTLSFEESKNYLIDYLQQLASNQTPNHFVTLFDELSKEIPATTTELYEKLHYSPRQCQRHFEKHFGISPKTVLSVLRFQYCLKLLTSAKATPIDVLDLTKFYDQSHFIREFKKNIGITPFEYVRKYKDY
jgi:AraC-like DNA-binding protein